MIILSTSANPFHDGHIQMLQWARKNSKGQEVLVDLCRVNADKGWIEPEELAKRTYDVKLKGWSVIHTETPLFTGKRLEFDTPKVTFLVGWDTYKRIVDPKYYGNDKVIMRQILHLLHRIGTEFVVFSRDGNDEIFYEVYNKRREPMFRLAEDWIPNPISSTQLRNE